MSCHIKRIKDKSYMINSIDTEKHLTQLNNFQLKRLKKSHQIRCRTNVPQHNKGCVWQDPGFPRGTSNNELTFQWHKRDIRDAGSIPGLGRSPGEGHGNTLQYSCLENPVDREPWQATVHRVTKSWKWLKRLSTHACVTSPQLTSYSVINRWKLFL